jgi:deferrochelatase/peroxidase EfeB
MAGGVAGGVVAGGIAGAASGSAHAASRPGPQAATNEAIVSGLLPPVAFHGQHQAGILPKSQRATAMVSFDATAQSRSELVDLFQTVTDRARRRRSASTGRRRTRACWARPSCRTGSR